ncbi:MAG: LacI family DNA-binding transcriptional regulator, partial [Egibacteraceae bacterium]
MRKRSVTLRDVAEHARVHPSTASRALNMRTRDLVNPTTVNRVLDVAEQLGYQPNSLARGLKMNRTFTIGMLIPDLTNPLFPPIVRGIEDGLVDAGYTLVLANTDNDADKERTIMEVMSRRRLDGLILATARRDYPLLDAVLASEMPVVLINRTADYPPVPSVTGDDHAGIGMAVKHLVSLGHTRIAHVAGTQSVTTGLARYQSFVSWLQSAGLAIDSDRIVFADWFQEGPGAEA